ncbi:hypothetical protein Poli38472_003090 [Pythium oligandrum]|uniref:FYVE-type domain-containing protein n=1 Tax=Pythium oligandrum TaxID=41045 RepID=A0A8K1FBE0_PYTOL|nr:hypothetical protein Poli38472_003090 [Pythium oligandrum]|eukprot:TMW57165.1 hypothetical protein Poli38472_003090 [Pythium oligandrum]
MVAKKSDVAASPDGLSMGNEHTTVDAVVWTSGPHDGTSVWGQLANGPSRISAMIERKQARELMAGEHDAAVPRSSHYHARESTHAPRYSTKEQPQDDDDYGRRTSQYKPVHRLAEMGEWSTLLERIECDPTAAQHKDQHGMLPLHWACTENDVPPHVVKRLLQAFPEAVLTRNNAQYLPIHIAVRSNACEETLRLLCDARPSSLLEETPSGKTPVMLALECNLPASTVEILRIAEQTYLDLIEENDSQDMEDTKRNIEVQSHLLRESMMYANNAHMNRMSETADPNEQPNLVGFSWQGPPRSKSHPLQQSNSMPRSQGRRNSAAIVRYNDSLMMHDTRSTVIDEEAEGYNSEDGSSRGGPDMRSTYSMVPHRQQQQQMYGQGGYGHLQQHQQQFAHRATEGDVMHYNSGVCGICYKKFSMFRKKHQCKGCGIYLCRKHVAGKIEFPDQVKKRSACADCYITHRHGPSLMPTVPSQSMGANYSFMHSGPVTSNAIVPANRANRTGSTPAMFMARKSTMRNSHLSTASTVSDMRHSMLNPSTRSSLRFGPLPPPNQRQQSQTMMVPMPMPKPPMHPLDRYGSSDTATTTSLSDSTDRNSAEVTALNHRVATLEEQNKVLLSRLADQEKQYDEAMLLLTQTMTRVADIEMRMTGMHMGQYGSEMDETDSELNPASYDYDYSMASMAAYGK